MQNELIQWYRKNKRDFPWRLNQNPYAIWISEIMLQQTTTTAVIPYFNRFMELFPTIESLANASLEEVYKAWEGLGYYRRAKHLHEAAQMIMQSYNGVFPKEYKDILSLKGIGPYTAGAISSIAFLQPRAAVDGNVLRIIARFDMIKDNVMLTTTNKVITKRITQLIQDVNPSDFNQGLMDLGATICTPRNPKCDLCPLYKECLSYKYNQQNILPVVIKNIKKNDLFYITGIITYKDQILLLKNKKGLLENLYGCVQYEVESPYTFIETFEEEFNVKLDIISYIQTIKHVFTHKTWKMQVYHFELNKPIEGLIPLTETNQIPISTAHKKVINAYLKQDS